MGNLRVIAVAAFGMSLVAACGAGRAATPTPAPVPAPSRTVSQSPASSQSPAVSPAATGIDADHAGQPLFLHFDGTRWSREYGPLFRTYAEDQQYDETDDVGRVGVARVPGTGTLWAVGSIGAGDDETDFVLRR